MADLPITIVKNEFYRKCSNIEPTTCKTVTKYMENLIKLIKNKINRSAYPILLGLYLTDGHATVSTTLEYLQRGFGMRAMLSSNLLHVVFRIFQRPQRLPLPLGLLRRTLETIFLIFLLFTVMISVPSSFLLVIMHMLKICICVQKSRHGFSVTKGFIAAFLLLVVHLINSILPCNSSAQ